MFKSKLIKIVMHVCLFLFFVFVLCRLYKGLYTESFAVTDLEANALIQLAKEQNDLLEEDSESELIDSSGEIQKLMIDTASAVDKINDNIEYGETTYDETTEYDNMNNMNNMNNYS